MGHHLSETKIICIPLHDDFFKKSINREYFAILCQKANKSARRIKGSGKLRVMSGFES